MNKNNSIKSDIPQQLPRAGSMPYSVPDTYFVALEQSIIDYIHTLKSLDSISKSPVYSLPHGYFESLESEILLSCRLDSMPKTNPYSIPVGYLENLDLSPISAPSYSVSPKLHTSYRHVFYRWAVAASILLFVGLSSLLFVQNNSLNTEQQIATLSSQEIDDYINAHKLDFDTDLTIQYDPIYLDPTHLNAVEQEIILQQLEELPDDEILSYL